MPVHRRFGPALSALLLFPSSPLRRLLPPSRPPPPHLSLLLHVARTLLRVLPELLPLRYWHLEFSAAAGRSVKFTSMKQSYYAHLSFAMIACFAQLIGAEEGGTQTVQMARLVLGASWSIALDDRVRNVYHRGRVQSAWGGFVSTEWHDIQLVLCRQSGTFSLLFVLVSPCVGAEKYAFVDTS